MALESITVPDVRRVLSNSGFHEMPALWFTLLSQCLHDEHSMEAPNTASRMRLANRRVYSWAISDATPFITSARLLFDSERVKLV